MTLLSDGKLETAAYRICLAAPGSAKYQPRTVGVATLLDSDPSL